jgi:ParB family chromosome partitioning protein
LPNIQLVSPFKCRMWDMHDRLGEEVSVRSCGSLIESLRKHGQKQPVLGRQIPAGRDYEMELIYGARRLFAARHLGIPLLVELRDIDDRAALIEMDIENRVRMDISPYERGVSYRRWLREGFFANQVEIAKGLGVSESQVSRLLNYADLPAAVVESFGSPREIREEWAVTLAKLCKDQRLRDTLLRRARAFNAAERRPAPHAVYDAFVNEGPNKVVSPRARDEIIKNSHGATIMRVGFRAKTVHLILPRDRLTPAALQQITEEIRHALETVSAASKPSEARRLGTNGHGISPQS